MLNKNIDITGKVILITGAAGFIGANLSCELLRRFQNIQIVGIDNLNDYYDVGIKKYRLTQIQKVEEEETGTFIFIKNSIANKSFVQEIFQKYQPSIVVNLAAQAGVRYSITNPDIYMESNVMGFYHILEACRASFENGNSPVEHFIYASSSSVYGMNQKIPYSVNDFVDSPVSLYAATKKSNELFAHVYSKLYNIPSTGLRFFTVYGPAGRPDMAYYGFTDKLRNNEKIQIFNYGKCKRDFTYIDDIVAGIRKIIQSAPKENKNGIPYKVYNIGNSQPVNLMDFVEILKEELTSVGILPSNYNFDDHIELVPMQPGDVETTYADVSELETDFGFKPNTDLQTGLRNFVVWYKKYYGL